MRTARSSAAAVFALAALVLSAGVGAYPHHHTTNTAEAAASCGAQARDCACPQDHLRRAGGSNHVDDCAICFLNRLAAGGPTLMHCAGPFPSSETRTRPAAVVVLEFSLASWTEARAPPVI